MSNMNTSPLSPEQLAQRVIELEAQVQVNAENIEHEEQENDVSNKWRNRILGMIAAVLWIGQWGDVVFVVDTVKDNFISMFTHEVEYKLLDNVDVGMTQDYFHGLVGQPKIIKQSKVNTNLHYEYIFNSKYLFIGIVEKQRLAGFVAIGLVEDFAPKLPFSELTLATNNLSKIQTQPETYISDYVNLEFFMESQSLGLQGLFMNQTLGYINYSGQTSSHAAKLKDLSDADMYGDENKIQQTVEALRDKVLPNFYAVSEVGADVVADALLTKYEYNKFK